MTDHTQIAAVIKKHKPKTLGEIVECLMAELDVDRDTAWEMQTLHYKNLNNAGYRALAGMEAAA